MTPIHKGPQHRPGHRSPLSFAACMFGLSNPALWAWRTYGARHELRAPSEKPAEVAMRRGACRSRDRGSIGSVGRIA